MCSECCVSRISVDIVSCVSVYFFLPINLMFHSCVDACVCVDVEGGVGVIVGGTSLLVVRGRRCYW